MILLRVFLYFCFIQFFVDNFAWIHVFFTLFFLYLLARVPAFAKAHRKGPWKRHEPHARRTPWRKSERASWECAGDICISCSGYFHVSCDPWECWKTVAVVAAASEAGNGDGQWLTSKRLSIEARKLRLGVLGFLGFLRFSEQQGSAFYGGRRKKHCGQNPRLETETPARRNGNPSLQGERNCLVMICVSG